MKLATYKDGSRDGQLVVVSHDLGTAHYANGIATRLQQVLDDWNFLSPQLQDLYVALNQGRARHAFPFDPARCMAPLPRAFEHVEGGAFLHHVERALAARGEAVPEALLREPPLRRACAQGLLGACDGIVVASEDFGVDVEAWLAAIVGDVPCGAAPPEALEGVRLLMPGAGVVLRHLEEADPLPARPSVAYGPVAVTPDELGEAWQGGRVHGTLQLALNGRPAGRCDIGTDMRFHFGQLISRLARTRAIGSGAIVATGAASSRDPAHGEGSLHGAAFARPRDPGAAPPAGLRHGDTVQVTLQLADGSTPFGALALTVAAAAD